MESRLVGVGDHPALLVVDASCGFTDPDSPLGADFTREILTINKLLDHAHDQGWPVFLSTVVYHNENVARVFREKLPALNELTPGSRWVEIDPRLCTAESDTVFEKTHASCFHGTKLVDWLLDKNVDTLLVTGFTTSGCVRASAVDALQDDFRVVVVTDAVGDRDSEAHEANLHDLGIKYADLLDARGVLARSV